MKYQFPVPVVLALAGLVSAQPPAYDVLIRNGRVLDGTGNPYVYADGGIRGDRIAASGDLRDAASRPTRSRGACWSGSAA